MACFITNKLLFKRKYWLVLATFIKLLNNTNIWTLPAICIWSLSSNLNPSRNIYTCEFDQSSPYCKSKQWAIKWNWVVLHCAVTGNSHLIMIKTKTGDLFPRRVVLYLGIVLWWWPPFFRSSIRLGAYVMPHHNLINPLLLQKKLILRPNVGLLIHQNVLFNCF